LVDEVGLEAQLPRHRARRLRDPEELLALCLALDALALALLQARDRLLDLRQARQRHLELGDARAHAAGTAARQNEAVAEAAVRGRVPVRGEGQREAERTQRLALLPQPAVLVEHDEHAERDLCALL